MNQTTNYQLNQWSKADRILMDDFNADNAKIDAALGGLESRAGALETSMAKKADSSTLSEVSGRAGAQLLKSGTLNEDSTSFKIPLTGINWNQWLAVHILIDWYGPTITIRTNDSPNFVNTSSDYSNTPTAADRVPCSLHLYPMFDSRTGVGGFFVHYDETAGYLRTASLRFKDLRHLTVVPNGSGGTIRAGSSYKVWGQK